ncbi:MAG: MFS transporter [Gammaproteobacteria bacterium]|nr:MFS transporter [Gammaproteobacteria bacterium]
MSSPVPGALPYWRLSGFYLFYFATLGALVPYWSPYLRSIGFSATEIGQLVAIMLATRIVAPNLWAWLSDARGGRCMPVVRVASALTVLFFAGVFVTTSFWGLALVMSLFSFFWNATLPQLEATTLNHLGPRSGEYTRIRLWGSMGFIATVIGVGTVLERTGADAVRPAVLVCMIGIWLASLMVPEAGVRVLRSGPIRQALWRGPVLAFLAACLLMQASHAPYYTFYTIYLIDHGYSRGLIGLLWALGVLAEIPVFLLMPRWLRHMDATRIFRLALLAAALRWVLIASFPDTVAMLVLAQGLHALSFGAFHAASIQIVHRMFRDTHQHRGQALYSSVSYGLGGALGGLYSGLAWDRLGETTTWLLAAGLALAGAALAARPLGIDSPGKGDDRGAAVADGGPG